MNRQEGLLIRSLRSAGKPISENTLNVALRAMGYSGRRNDLARLPSHGFDAP